jgi:hypothetical protein
MEMPEIPRETGVHAVDVAGRRGVQILDGRRATTAPDALKRAGTQREER